MNASQHFEALAAADLALAQAHDNLNAVREAAAEVSPIKIGQRVPGKTSNGGVDCEMEVVNIWVHTGQSMDGIKFLSLRLGGKKVKKDGSLANIECYAFLSVAL